MGRNDAALEVSAIAESALIEDDSVEVARPSLGHLSSKKREQLREVLASSHLSSQGIKLK